MSAHISAIYHLPFFYQAKGRSASQSGIDIFPYVLGMVFANIASGIAVRKIGRYWPFMITGPIIGAIGAGLLYTINANTSNAKLIGYQIITGFGIGNTFQAPIMAVQSEFADQPGFISQASAVQICFQLLGAVVGISYVLYFLI
jgi:MFS family permease